MEKAVLLYMVILVFHHFGVEVGVAQTAEASFNDSSCNVLVCPDTPLFFTCTVTGSMATVATIRLPSGQVVNIHSDNTTSLGGGGLPEGVTIQSHDAVGTGLANYSLTLAIERASILTGSAIICVDGGLSPETDQAKCPVATAQPPQNLRHIVSSNTEDSAEIQWQRPVVTEGSEIFISSYTVNVSDEAGGQVMSESVPDDDGDGTFSHTISGLDYNTNYTVEVTTTNSCGDTSDPVSIYVFIEPSVPPKPTLGPLQMNCSQPLEDGRSVKINWMLGMGETGLVYPGEERSTVLLSPAADDGNCVNISGTNCETKISAKDDYNVNLTIQNGIGDSDPERSSFFSGALLIENNLTDDRSPSVTVTINIYCFEAFYIVTVRFGKSRESDTDSCDFRQTEKAGLMPADDKEFHVNTTLIKLNDNEMYCFNATLEEVSSTNTPPTTTDDDALDPPVIGGIAVAAIVLIFGFIIGIIIAYLIYCKLTRTSKKDDQEMKTLGTNSPDSPAPTCQDPNTISRTPHPTTGELYTQVDLSSKKKEAGQDPSTIEHQEAPGGELYAMPQKSSKKGKKKKDEETHELTEEEKAALYSVPDRKGQKAKSEGLTYAQLDIHTSNKQAPPSQGSTYADIRL